MRMKWVIFVKKTSFLIPESFLQQGMHIPRTLLMLACLAMILRNQSSSLLFRVSSVRNRIVGHGGLQPTWIWYFFVSQPQTQNNGNIYFFYPTYFLDLIQTSIVNRTLFFKILSIFCALITDYETKGGHLCSKLVIQIL